MTSIASRASSVKRKTLASLNHPNIAAIYGLEESGGMTALVMELVEERRGRSLVAVRIASFGADFLDRRSPADREADRRGARSRARAGHHPPRSQTGQHQGAPRRHGEGARLRAGESDGPVERAAGSGDARALDVANDHVTGDDDGRRRAPGHGRLHVAGAGEGARGGQTQRHLGVWGRALRDADRQAGLRGRGPLRHARERPEDRSRLVGPPPGYSTRDSDAASELSHQGSPASCGRHFNRVVRTREGRESRATGRQRVGPAAATRDRCGRASRH